MAKKPNGARSASVAAETATEVTPVQATPAQHDTTASAISATVEALKDSVAGAVAGYEKTQIEVKTTMDKAVKSAEEMMTFSQGNFEALMKAGQIWAAGVQELGKALSATAQAQAEATMGTFKAMSAVKSLKEAMDLQATLARSSLETAMAESGKLTDASVKLAEQAMAPITARVTLAVEKFGRAA